MVFRTANPFPLHPLAFWDECTRASFLVVAFCRLVARKCKAQAELASYQASLSVVSASFDVLGRKVSLERLFLDRGNFYWCHYCLPFLDGVAEP